MKKLIVLLIVIHSFVCSAFQSGGEQMKKIDGKNYIVYKVQSGDGWYSIARKFGITYSELRVANKNTDDKLVLGKEILIPADKLKANDPYYDKNHLDNENTAPKKLLENKYHIVAPSQTLFSISKMYNVSVDQIKSWNNLTSNSISKGQKLIVGKAEVLETPIKETNEPVKKEEIKKEVIIVPAVADVKPKPAAETSTAVEQINTDKYDSIKIPTEIDSPPQLVNAKEPEIKTEKNNETDTPSPIPNDNIVFANGRKEINESGIALRMEEEDQNQDKYFALHKTAPIGTVIRVSNPLNSAKIYVKVTGTLTDSPENNGVIIKLSKASADKLGAMEKTFQVNLLYGISPE